MGPAYRDAVGIDIQASGNGSSSRWRRIGCAMRPLLEETKAAE
ncbi:hypothetical protein BURPSS13_I0336 [Burkholderia pseudomallei S13]|nr:hypothetical protein BURPSS13_I0336 [Burkholderia pseudomallei S13]